MKKKNELELTCRYSESGVWQCRSKLSFENVFHAFSFQDDKGQLIIQEFLDVVNQYPGDYFFEMPPLDRKTFHRPFEFVLTPATFKPRVANPKAFSAHFKDHKNNIAVFPNLTKESLLIAPTPILHSPHPKKDTMYLNLSHFLREGPPSQIRQLLSCLSQTLMTRLSEISKPVYVSTSGQGVPWLHVRLDPVPKYYTYVPYMS